MTDEPLTPKKEEAAKSLLDQIKEERIAVEKANADAVKHIARMEELKALEMMSGKTDSGQPIEKTKEETPAEYLKRIREGKF